MAISYVYAVAALGPRGPEAVKIGFSSHVEQRVRAMRTYSWLPLRLVAVEPFVDKPLEAVTLETDLHVALDEFRLEGEWFSWHPEVKAEIRARLRQHDVELLSDEWGL